MFLYQVLTHLKPTAMKTIKTSVFTMGIILFTLYACDKNDSDTTNHLTGTTWVCDTNYFDQDYYYRITFTSENEFDYYENGFFEFEDYGTYKYNPPVIEITLWGITIEGSIEGNKLYYPMLPNEEIGTIVRVFTKQ